MPDATASLKMPNRSAQTGAEGSSSDVSNIVMHALLLIGHDRSKALDCLDRAREMMATSEEQTASAPPAALPPVAKGGLAPWQISKIKRYINENIDESITLLVLAGQLRLSVSYFSAAFKVSFGVSPHAYIVAQRVERAKQRIALTDASLSEIALDCGLADQAHLSRIFRRHTGYTPSGWRRACASGMEGRLS
ncbi:helix-turn-helix domain-containing protein [Martelella mediterranea]|uniref:Bacillibactin transport regulator n=1 Tax=Martelella mediterranea DSM 17316 TaxID=1122214 RepID=A0A1U9Z3E3_9HYPH|nr:AraC family transcriptional regulator [Martelella mediterranea]AQZ52211.1 Bacillibactin transport regulator [Martelella mediterranea DSM 17316]